MKKEELIYALALQHVSKIGDITANKLIHHCGSPQAVFEEKKEHLLKIDGIGSLLISDLFNKNHLKQAEEELKFTEQNKVTCLYFKDDDYPEKLKHCIDGPIVLFQKGKINLKNKRILSIVGTRNNTNYVKGFCNDLIEKLKVYNPVIVSGFAYSNDITAQKAAIKHNLQTIGCLAHGFNLIYPKVHAKYHTQVEENGGFFTDFWSTDTFDKTNFLKRNRIIAGLSEATVVIESAEKGGSLVTVDIADSYNRDIFAVPGRTTDMYSVGCNNLIKQHRAHVLSTPLDIPYILNWQLQDEKRKTVQKKLFVELDSTEKIIYNYLKENDKQLLDVISLNCNLPTFKVASTLLNME